MVGLASRIFNGYGLANRVGDDIESQANGVSEPQNRWILVCFNELN